MTAIWFDDEGNIRKTQVYIVWGAPASGKTTYVREHMQNGDLVIDVDSIRNALTMQGEHSDSEALLEVILEVRETLYRMVENKTVQCRTVWVISLLPGYMEREKLAERLEAQLIHIDTRKDECLRRMRADPLRSDKQNQAQLIDKFFQQLEV